MLNRNPTSPRPSRVESAFRRSSSKAFSDSWCQMVLGFPCWDHLKDDPEYLIHPHSTICWSNHHFLWIMFLLKRDKYLTTWNEFCLNMCLKKWLVHRDVQDDTLTSQNHVRSLARWKESPQPASNVLSRKSRSPPTRKSLAANQQIISVIKACPPLI